MKDIVVAAAIAVLSSAAAYAAESKSVTRDGRTVEFVECEKCEMRARFAADGKHATVNVSRLKDDSPNKHTLQHRRKQLMERAFEVMEAAASSEQPFWGEEIVKTWRSRGLPSYVVRREGRAVALVKDVGEAGGRVRELALYNMEDATHSFDVSFASLDLEGGVKVLDLTERAIPPPSAAGVAVKVAPKSARIFRLSAERRVERTLFSTASATSADESSVVWSGVTIANGGRRTLEFTCKVEADAMFFVKIGESKPARVEVRAIEGMASIGIGEVMVAKGVWDVHVYAAEGEKLPAITEMRMYR